MPKMTEGRSNKDVWKWLCGPIETTPKMWHVLRWSILAHDSGLLAVVIGNTVPVVLEAAIDLNMLGLVSVAFVQENGQRATSVTPTPAGRAALAEHDSQQTSTKSTGG